MTKGGLVPALPPVPNTVQVSLISTYGSDTRVVNRLFVQYPTTPPTVANLNDLGAALVTSWTTATPPTPTMQGKTVETFVQDEIQLLDLNSDTGAEVTVANGATGTDASQGIPADAAMIINYGVGRHYRGGKPRTYLTGLPIGFLATPQTWNPTDAEAVNTAWQHFIGPFSQTVGGFLWTGLVNVSRYHGFTVVTNPITGRARNVPTPRAVPLRDALTSTSANLHVGSQRRRSLIRQ
jgi:hypothetical protein